MEKKEKKPIKTSADEGSTTPFSEERIIAIEMLNSVGGVYKDVAFSFGAGAQVEVFEGLAQDLIKAGHAIAKK